MKARLILMLIALTFVGSVFGQNTSTKKVAILDPVIKVGITNDDKDGIKVLLGGYLTGAVTAIPGYEGYDRVNIASVMDEHKFQRTGLVNDIEIKKLGEMTGAAYILVAEVARYDNKLIVSARTIDVETAKVGNAATVTSSQSADELEAKCLELVRKLFGGSNTGGTTVVLRNNTGRFSSGRDFIETAAGLNMKMVYVEGGDFLMGATAEQGSEGGYDEQVIRRVWLDSYYIGECEVTQAQWAKVMGTSVQQQASKAGQSTYRGIGSDYPMYYVSWEEAQAFCQELSRMTGKTYCLPTEAQWEYAARGGKKADGTKYSGSMSIVSVAWCNSNSGLGTHSVKNKCANGLGLYDMSGNVWEWCSDWYSDSYNVNDTNNPTGPSSGLRRVLRGGGWNSDACCCRVSYRVNYGSGSRFGNSGFRVVVLP